MHHSLTAGLIEKMCGPQDKQKKKPVAKVEQGFAHVFKANPYHAADGTFTSKGKDADGKPRRGCFVGGFMAYARNLFTAIVFIIKALYLYSVFIWFFGVSPVAARPLGFLFQFNKLRNFRYGDPSARPGQFRFLSFLCRQPCHEKAARLSLKVQQPEVRR